MEDIYVELVLLVFLLLGNVLAGTLPLLVSSKCLSQDDPEQSWRRDRILVFFLHFGTGTFLSTCLLVLLPQSRVLFEMHEESQLVLLSDSSVLKDSSHEGHHENFPIPEFLVLCGFFFVFALQEALHYALYHFGKQSSASPRVRFCSCAKRHTECSRTFKADNPEQTLFGLERRRNTDYSGEYSNLPTVPEHVPELSSNLMRSSILSQPVPNYGSVGCMTDTPTEPPLPLPTPQVVIAKDGSVSIVQRPPPTPDRNTSTNNLFLLLTLSCYGIFQGILIGRATQTATWERLLADCLQQVISVFVIGCIGLSQIGTVVPCVSYVATLSVMSPLGMGLNMLLKERLKSVSLTIWGSGEALVCGSLLFLTFCDLMRRRQLKEFSHFLRFAAFTIGSAAIAVLQYLSTAL